MPPCSHRFWFPLSSCLFCAPSLAFLFSSSRVVPGQIPSCIFFCPFPIRCYQVVFPRLIGVVVRLQPDGFLSFVFFGCTFEFFVAAYLSMGLVRLTASFGSFLHFWSAEECALFRQRVLPQILGSFGSEVRFDVPQPFAGFCLGQARTSGVLFPIFFPSCGDSWCFKAFFASWDAAIVFIPQRFSGFYPPWNLPARMRLWRHICPCLSCWLSRFVFLLDFLAPNFPFFKSFFPFYLLLHNYVKNPVFLTTPPPQDITKPHSPLGITRDGRSCFHWMLSIDLALLFSCLIIRAPRPFCRKLVWFSTFGFRCVLRLVILVWVPSRPVFEKKRF